MKIVRLLVLSPPQDIEMKVLNIRSHIFSACGFTSALALPIFIPLYPLHDDIPVSVIEKSLSGYRFSGFEITTLKLAQVSGSLFLSINGGDALINLFDSCRRIVGPLPESRERVGKDGNFNCFPFYSGFFLACNERNTDEWEFLCNTRGTEVFSFHHFYISLLVIHIYSVLDTWWENVEWEIPIQVKNRT